MLCVNHIIDIGRNYGVATYLECMQSCDHFNYLSINENIMHEYIKPCACS